MEGWLSAVSVTVTVAVVLVAIIVQVFLYVAKKKKKSLMVNVELAKGDEFSAVVKRRMDHISEYIEGEDYKKPLLPDSFATITETNNWETAFDLNPSYRDSNWVGLSEYLSACKIKNHNARQAVAESFLATFQRSLIKSSGLPFPITWFLPKKVKQGKLPVHPLQLIQISLIATPSLMTALAETKNFSDREIKRIQPGKKKSKDKKETPSKLQSRLPSHCKLTEVFEYYEDENPKASLGNPMNQKLFPGLYKGFAPHNPPAFKGKHATRNRIVSEVCNRFMKNVSVDVNLPSPSMPSQLHSCLVLLILVCSPWRRMFHIRNARWN